MGQQSLWRTDDDQTEVYAAGGGARSNRCCQAPQRGPDRSCSRRTQAPHDDPEHPSRSRQADHLAASDAKPIVVGLEPTGNYHRVLAHRLIEAGFGVRLISSMALARTREALHNGWDKNDPKDAQVILHMLGIGATMVYQDPLAAGINDLQELSKTHEVVSKAKTQIWHRLLTHYLPLYFPEIERFVGNSRSDWFLAFLERFPTPDGITGLTKEGFVAAAWDVVGRKVSKARLLAISMRRRAPRPLCRCRSTRPRLRCSVWF